MSATARTRLESDSAHSRHDGPVTTTMVTRAENVTASTRSIVALDAEKEGWRYTTAYEVNTLLHYDSLLAGVPTGWHGCVLVVEDPHFRPGREGSRAQVYTAAELERLITMFAEAGITVRLANAMHTAPRRRSTWIDALDAEGEPDKARDSEALYAWTVEHGYEDYKRWPQPPSQHDEALERIRRDMVRRQNAMRSIRVGLGKAEADKARMLEAFGRLRSDAFLVDFALADAFKWMTNDEVEPVESKGRKERPPRPVFEAVWTACTDADGKLRLNDRSQFIGVRFVMERVLQLHEYGRGLGRSQYMYHTLRVDEKRRFGKYDPCDPATYHREERAVGRRQAQAHTRLVVAALRDYLMTPTEMSRTQSDSRHSRA